MLQAKELQKQGDQLKNNRLKAMTPVLHNLFNTLKTHANQNTESPYFAFHVPAFVFGYPLYNHEEAVQYVCDTLTEQGFQVWKLAEGNIFISWMKVTKKEAPKAVPPKLGPDYRPFVYDESAFSYLTK